MSTSNDILHEYLQISRHMTDKIRISSGQLNLTYPQSIVLSILEADGPMPISALAEAAGSANSTISGVVDRLEKMGLVQRQRSESDRRVIYVSTTEKFKSQYAEFQNTASNHFTSAIAKLSPDETKAVERGLSLLKGAMQEEDV